MGNNIIMELINNAALLMTLCIVYEISYIIPIKQKKFTPIFTGFLIGLIGLAVMSIPFKLAPGIVFDTRSILIGVTALTFGIVPAAIAGGIAIIYRLIEGGVGALTGIAVIIASVVIGSLWRDRIIVKQVKCLWAKVYLFGVTVHMAMLACMFILPWPTSLQVVKEISLPVMLIYPIGTVLLSLLLLRQKERNETLLQVAEAEARYQSLFDNNHAVMFLLDPNDGQIIEANPAACQFYGWSADTMKTMNISQINTLSPEEINAEMKKSVEEKRSHFLFKHRRANTSPIDVEVYSGPIRLNGRTLLYSIVHDISLRVAADEALQESESRFRQLVENAPDAIFISSSDKFTFLNQSALSLFGAECPEQLIGTSVMDRIHPDYRNFGKARNTNVGGKAVSPLEQVYVRLDGSPVYVDVTQVPIFYSNRDGAIVFARDITERKYLEEKTNEVEAQLRQQQKLEAIGTLAGGVAHEINNPINGIMNYAQLILDAVDKTSVQAEYSKEIIHETERVSVIVKNLLQFSRQEKQSHSYANIYDIVNQTISLVNTIIKKDQIILDVLMDDDLPDIKCRSQQIQQVIMNLLTNARDALNEKYIDYNENKIIRLRCSQYKSNDRRWIRLTVEDHGNGIPKELQEKIFEPFFSTKPKDKGTGLGLSISFGIVKDHHGEISIDTQEGLFTKFILDLPVDNGWNL